jgi:hypothetical protein
VNNFNLGQLKVFSDFIQSEQYIKVENNDFGEDDDDNEEDGWQQWLRQVPQYNFNVSLRFQMDDRAYKSAKVLRHECLMPQAAPESLADWEARKRWLGVAEIVTECVPRTGTPRESSKTMTVKQARRIKTKFRKLRSDMEDVMDRLADGWPEVFEGSEISDSFFYMRVCWFEPFYAAVGRMIDADVERRDGRRNEST